MDPIENVEHIAENMQNYPLEHYLTGRSLYLMYDDEVGLFICYLAFVLEMPQLLCLLYIILVCFFIISIM